MGIKSIKYLLFGIGILLIGLGFCIYGFAAEGVALYGTLVAAIVGLGFMIKGLVTKD